MKLTYQLFHSWKYTLENQVSEFVHLNTYAGTFLTAFFAIAPNWTQTTSLSAVQLRNILCYIHTTEYTDTHNKINLRRHNVEGKKRKCKGKTINCHLYNILKQEKLHSVFRVVNAQCRGRKWLPEKWGEWLPLEEGGIHKQGGHRSGSQDVYMDGYFTLIHMLYVLYIFLYVCHISP